MTLCQSLIPASALLIGSCAFGADRITWMSQNDLMDAVHDSTCSVNVVYASGKPTRSIPASGRDVQRFFSNEVFGEKSPRFALGRFHFVAIESSNKESAKDLNIQFGRKGGSKDGKILALLVENIEKAPSRAPAFHYQAEDYLIGPVFELSPDTSMTYQFQCLLNRKEPATTNDSPVEPDAVLPNSSRDGSLGAGAR